MTLPAKIIEYLQGLTLTGGDHDGELFEVLQWERRFIRGAFGTPGNSALSIARGNGKSALVAGIATAVVDPKGPLHGRRREVVCAASSFAQGKIIFEDVQEFLRERYDIGKRREWRLQDSQNVATLEHRESRARVRCIGSDPRRAHGLRPAVALCDEPAQWDSSRSDKMLAAIRTGLGKVPGSKMIGLGTRPAFSEHWFSKMLNGQGAGYVQVHAADKDDPDFLLKTIRKANPSFDHLPSLQAELAEEIKDAKLDPAHLSAWRALRLNLGVSDTVEKLLLDAGTWERAEGDRPRIGRCVLGVDLGGSEAQSAIAAFWPESGRLETMAAFPQHPTLQERGLQDGVGRLYVDCAERGELIQCGGHAVSIPDLLRAARQRFGDPAGIAADRWKNSELVDALKEAEIPVCPVEWRGQGFKDGGTDVRAFRKAITNGDAVPVVSLLMRSAMAEARTKPDDASNWKLAKKTEAGRRSRARDDAAAASILAVALGTRIPTTPQQKWRYRGSA